ncbi:MAG: hypothetical protein JKY89_00315 [Immundisolibacteraceae bacterium]|nr:hypothetical protein [Immundisolibacteraceae bacterium]
MSYKKVEFNEDSNLLMYEFLFQKKINLDEFRFFWIHQYLISSGKIKKLSRGAKIILPVIARFCCNEENSYEIEQDIIATLSGYKSTKMINNAIQSLVDNEILIKLNRNITIGRLSNKYKFINCYPYTKDLLEKTVTEVFTFPNQIIDTGIWAKYSYEEKMLLLYVIVYSKLDYFEIDRIGDNSFCTNNFHLSLTMDSLKWIVKAIGLNKEKLQESLKGLESNVVFFENSQEEFLFNIPKQDKNYTIKIFGKMDISTPLFYRDNKLHLVNFKAFLDGKVDWIIYEKEDEKNFKAIRINKTWV